MVTHVALPKLRGPAKLVLDPDHPLSDKAYVAFCEANPELRLERTAHGEIVIVPLSGGETSFREGEVIGDLSNWAMRDRRGKAFGPGLQFILPSGAFRSPDAA